MRIISGKYKGRKVEGYNIDGTRPTMDRVKESMIAMIQNKINDSVCLDLFAGSGSIGFELISNGAKSIYFVDNNFKVTDTLKKNVKELRMTEDVNILKSDFKDALTKFSKENLKFDIIFLDPPYKMNFITPAIRLIKELNLLNNDGIIICEYENESIDYLDYEIIKDKKYGSKYISIIRGA